MEETPKRKFGGSKINVYGHDMTPDTEEITKEDVDKVIKDFKVIAAIDRENLGVKRSKRPRIGFRFHVARAIDFLRETLPHRTTTQGGPLEIIWFLHSRIDVEVPKNIWVVPDFIAKRTGGISFVAGRYRLYRKDFRAESANGVHFMVGERRSDYRKGQFPRIGPSPRLAAVLANIEARERDDAFCPTAEVVGSKHDILNRDNSPCQS